MISVYLLYMGGLTIISSDQQDESIWKILAMENWPILALKHRHRVLLHNSY